MVNLMIPGTILILGLVLLLIIANPYKIKLFSKWQISTILKVFGIIVFVVYCFRLLSGSVYDPSNDMNTTADLIDSVTSGIFTKNYIGLTNFSPAQSLLIIILRWFTTITWATAVLGPFVKAKTIKNINTFILPIVVILNIVFFKTNVLAMVGVEHYSLFGYRTIQFMIELVVMGLYVICWLYHNINKNMFKDLSKDLKKTLLMLVLLMAAFFPQGLFCNCFGEIGIITKEFSVIHRITLYFAIAFMLFAYFFLRNKAKEDIRLFFLIISLSGFAQYFVLFSPTIGPAAYPLHLCNTAIIMMFFAFVFDLKGVFYFTYFVNVLGALCAMILPNVKVDAFSIDSVRFWYNHIYAFTIPILGVALKAFPRPNIKMIGKAIGFFSLYFITVVILNAFFNRDLLASTQEYNTDYFFTYSSFFAEKFTFVTNLQYKHVWQITIGDHFYNIFYLFQPAIYVVYIGLMFVTWYVYDFLFKVSDDHYLLMVKKAIKKEHLGNMKKDLKRNELSEPLDKEAIRMVKISHFTKTYGNSKHKSVDDFSLEIHDGEVFGFLGHNGAGKSTTIKSLVGIQSITSGTIEICGYDITKQPLEAKLHIGYVSDNHAVYEKLTGREYINYVADLYQVPKEERDKQIAKYSQMFALNEALDREIKGYSHGMKQKLVVISSLVHNPKVWVLDEPLTGLDPTSSFQIKECMREHANNGNIVFFSSHVIEVVEKISDRIAIIGQGKLRGVFSMKELEERGISLEELYLKYVNIGSGDDVINLDDFAGNKNGKNKKVQ